MVQMSDLGLCWIAVSGAKGLEALPAYVYCICNLHSSAKHSADK